MESQNENMYMTVSVFCYVVVSGHCKRLCPFQNYIYK